MNEVIQDVMRESFDVLDDEYDRSHLLWVSTSEYVKHSIE